MIRFRYRWGWLGFVALHLCYRWLWAARRLGVMRPGTAVWWWHQTTGYLVRAERVEQL